MGRVRRVGRLGLVGIVTAKVLLAWRIIAAPAIDPTVFTVLTRYLRFDAGEIAQLDRGAIVKRGLDAKAGGEVAVAGAVRVNAPKAAFVDAVRDIARFKKSRDVLEIGTFSSPPALSDLAPLTVTRDDFDMRECRVGDCPVRLPADVIRRAQQEIDSRSQNAQAQTAAFFKQALLTHVTAYVTGGPGLFTSYDDGSKPIRPGEEFSGILRNAPSLGTLMPRLPEHLLGPSEATLPGAEDLLYWSKENFGSAPPFITVTHVVIACPSAFTCVVASRDVYSSRYLDASLALTIATDAGSSETMYLVYANRSRANALKGAFSGLRKAIVERRARSTLEESLKAVKVRLEKRG